jgi:hypothetical protein
MQTCATCDGRLSDCKQRPGRPPTGKSDDQSALAVHRPTTHPDQAGKTNGQRSNAAAVQTFFIELPVHVHPAGSRIIEWIPDHRTPNLRWRRLSLSFSSAEQLSVIIPFSQL